MYDALEANGMAFGLALGLVVKHFDLCWYCSMASERGDVNS